MPDPYSFHFFRHHVESIRKEHEWADSRGAGPKRRRRFAPMQQLPFGDASRISETLECEEFRVFLADTSSDSQFFSYIIKMNGLRGSYPCIPCIPWMSIITITLCTRCRASYLPGRWNVTWEFPQYWHSAKVICERRAQGELKMGTCLFLKMSSGLRVSVIDRLRS